MRRWSSCALATALLLLSALVFAQSPSPEQTPGEYEHSAQGMHHRRLNAEEQLDRLSRQLKLSDEQKEKIKPILEDQVAQVQSLRQDTSLAPQERRAKFQEIHQNAMSRSARFSMKVNRRNWTR